MFSILHGASYTVQMDRFGMKPAPTAGVRRAGMAQLEQVQHAWNHLAGAVATSYPKPGYNGTGPHSNRS